MKILRHGLSDLGPALVMPCHAFAYLVLASHFSATPISVLLVASPLVFLLSIQCSAANHNHFHRPIFGWKPLNVTLTAGYSIVSGPKTFHNIGHSLHHSAHDTWNEVSAKEMFGLNKSVRGWIVDFLRFIEAFSGLRALRMTQSLGSDDIDTFCSKWLPGIYDGTRWADRAKRSYNLSRIRLEAAVGASFRILLICINWQFVVFYFMPIAYLSDIFRRGENYMQHWGATDPEDPSRDSVSSYGWLYNAWTFNLGYHQEHHFAQNVHWTRLRGLTDQLPLDRRVVRFCHYVNLPCFFPDLAKRLKNATPVDSI